MNNKGTEELVIHRLIAKGKENETQTLLVLGTSKVKEPIWVRFGEKNPEGKIDINNWGKIERASFFDSCEICSLDENSEYSIDQNTNDISPFGIPHGEDTHFWLARFDFPDHTGDSLEHKGLEQRWLDLNKTSSKNNASVPFQVMASFDESDLSRQNDKNSDWSIKAFDLKQVKYTPLFEVGVLFVHGIGERKVRETLIQFGEPFVEFWKNWLKQSTIFAKSHIAVKSRKNFIQNVENGVLKNRQDQRVHDLLLDVFAEPDSTSTHQTTKLVTSPSRSLFVSAGLHVEDTIFKDTGSEKPTSSLLRLMMLRSDGSLKEAHVLMTEAFWTNETIYPTSFELLGWILRALPLSISMQINFFATSIKTAVSDSKLWSFYRLIMFLIKAPLILVTGIIIQPLLFIAAIVGLIPIAWVRAIAKWIFNSLTNTIGQSYALKVSVIRRNAIMRRVMKDLEWMNQRCQKIVVISHSQGAEISRLVLGMQRWPKIKRWVTAGAGIVPLTFLDKSHSRFMPKVSLILSGFLSISTIFILVVSVNFLLNFNEDIITSSFNTLKDLVADYPFGFYLALVFSCILIALFFEKPQFEPGVHKDTKKVWHNYYGTDDPVSCGSIRNFYDDLPDNTHHSDEWAKCIPEKGNEIRIVNTLSMLNDHTSYFNNTEQFIAPLALDIFELAGFKLHKNQKKDALVAASNCRITVSTLFNGISILTLIVFWFSFLHELIGEHNRWQKWQECIKCAWSSTDGFFDFLKNSCGIEAFVQDFKLPILIILVYVFVKYILVNIYESFDKPFCPKKFIDLYDKLKHLIAN